MISSPLRDRRVDATEVAHVVVVDVDVEEAVQGAVVVQQLALDGRVRGSQT